MSMTTTTRQQTRRSSEALVEYLEGQGWHPTYHRYGSDFYLGHCPFHADHTPSFTIQRGYATCRGSCAEWWSLPGLIAACEGIPVGKEAYRRARSYGYVDTHPFRERSSMEAKQEVVLRPPAPEQQETLSVMMAWWHECLWHPRCKRAFAYLTEGRGVGLSTMAQPQLGYAPSSHESWLWDEMPRFVSARLGGTWLQRLKEVGVMTEKGRLRVQDRLMFTCLSPSGGAPVFYTGRVMPGALGSAKYLNPPDLQKVPFWLPRQGTPAVEGTVVVESPVGVAVGHQHRLDVVATLGNDSLIWRNYTGCQTPFWIATDNDVPREKNDVPGEKQAAALQDFFTDKHHALSYRIRPAKEDKGFDEWLHHQGIAPFLEAVREKSPMREERTGEPAVALS